VQSLQGNNPIYQNPLVAWLVIVMLIGLSLLGASYLLYQKEHAKTTIAARKLAHSHALLTNAILDDLHRIILAATQDYLDDPGPHNREQLTRLLKHRQATNPHIMDLLILDGQGETAVWTGSGSPPVARNHAYVQHHLNQTDSLSYISPPQLSRVHQDAWFFSLSRAIHNEQGELQAVGVAIISISAMEQNFGSLLDTENLSITLLHQNGQMLLRIPRHDQQTGVDLGAFANIPLPLPLLAPLTQDYSVGLDGKPRIAYFLPLEDHPLILATSASLEPALLTWRNNNSTLASLWLLFALSTLWIARKLAQSVRNERATQALYQNLYAHVSDAIFLIEVQKHAPRFRFIGSNPAHARSTGIPNQKLQGKTPEQLLDSDTARQANDNYARCVREKQSISYEEELALPSGQRTWMTTLNPVSNTYGQVSLIIGISRDITEQSAFTQRLKSITHNLPGFVYQLQMNPDGQMHYPYASENVVKLFDVSAEQVMADADTLLSMIHPDDYDRVMEESMQTVAQGGDWHGEFRMIHPAGHTLWVEAHDTPQTLADGSILWTGYVNDITEKKRTEEALSLSEAKFRMFVENANDVIYTLDPTGQLTYISPNWTEILGHPVEEAIGENIATYLHPDDRLHCQAFLRNVMEIGNKQGSIEYRIHHKNGEWRWHASSGAALRDQQGEIIAYLGIARDITERKIAEVHITHLAHYDALTDLPNRTLFFEMVQRALGTAKRQNGQLALMFIDLDRFKPVNDQHGHAIGDLLLQQVAERMSHTLRDADIVARIGGDEFVVLLHRIEHAEDALIAAEKIRHQLCQTFHINQLQLAISCSIGVALYPEHGQELTELSRHADIAMYQAKEAGRNNTQLFHPQMLKDA